ncbi:MAG: type II toxin-antitoxin system HicA family toxin [Defluviitaleaceae bacterium]|nr:type II toxin-antitoxin system HicA family toxin [Defluviitaleaceae bacterium]
MNKNVYNSVISGNSDYNVNFADFRKLLIDLGFKFVRQRGSHMIYQNAAIDEFMNIQVDGNKAKAYQVRQLRNIILKHNL